MTSIQPSYDVVIIGSGHNGLVSACYLAKTGLSVLVLERNTEPGGATRSARVFDGVDARLSTYAYLVSLLPEKIVADLGLDLELKFRRTASWTPSFENGGSRELLIRNGAEAEARNREAFVELTGDERDYRGYLEFQEMQQRLAAVIWPSLTDDSILSDDLKRRGFHTLTLFGLDMPYRLFEQDNERVRGEVLAKYLAGINRHLEEPIESCLASDANGDPCVEAMSPVDLENKVHLPKGNIFHGDITWPFVDDDDEAGQWGVETGHPNLFLCGSAARRGGAVSGIPGHDAAMKVLESETTRG